MKATKNHNLSLNATEGTFKLELVFTELYVIRKALEMYSNTEKDVFKASRARSLNNQLKKL